MARGNVRKALTDLDNTERPLSRWTNDVLAAVTIVSIASLVLETVPSLASYTPTFHIIEYVCVGIFTIEYVWRLVIARPPTRYLFSFFGVIDLLAIIPTYLGLTNLTALKSARAIRILRFLRLLRLAKLGRTSRLHGQHDVEEVWRLNLQIYVLTVVALLVFMGSALYVFEHHQAAFSSIPSSMFWLAHIAVGGEPYAMPSTWMGQGLEVVSRFLSLILFGFLIHVIGTTINHFLLGTKLRKKEAVS